MEGKKVRVVVETQQGEESDGLKLEFAARECNLDIIITPTTPEGALARLCITPSDEPQVKLFALGEGRKNPRACEIDIDADPRFWAPNANRFFAVDEENHPLKFGISTGRLLAKGEKDPKGTTSSSRAKKGRCVVGSVRFSLSSDGRSINASYGHFSEWEDIESGRYRVEVWFGCTHDSYKDKNSGEEIVVPGVVKGQWSATCEFSISIS